jgi:uncharacterized membrane protein (DUF485 family)
MDKTLVKKIQNNPNYVELVSKRGSFALKLAIFVLAMFYSYILVIAFNKELLGTKVSEDAVSMGTWVFNQASGVYELSTTTEMLVPVLTWAFPVAAGIIIVSFITTLIYVNRANGEFEDLTDAIREDVKDDL